MFSTSFYFNHLKSEKAAICTYSVDSFVRLTVKTDERFLRTDSVYIMDKIQDICDESLIKYEFNTRIPTSLELLGDSPYSVVELDLYLSPTLTDEGYVMVAQTVVSLIWGIDAGPAAILGENIKAKPVSYEDKKKQLDSARAALVNKKIEVANAKEKVENITERLLAVMSVESLDDRSW